MNDGDKYLNIYLKNGICFSVKGESANDIPTSVVMGRGFVQFEKIWGNKTISILSSEIVAIEEAQWILEDPPF